MDIKTLIEKNNTLVSQAQAAKQKEKEIKAAMKAQQQIIIREFKDNLSAEDKAAQIATAEELLAKAKIAAEVAQQEYDIVKNKYDIEMNRIKADTTLATEILKFVNWQQSASLPKVSIQSYTFEGNSFVFKREGLKDITIDITKTTWKTDFKKALSLQGINGDNRIADNLVYTAGLKLAEELAARKNKQIKK